MNIANDCWEIYDPNLPPTITGATENVRLHLFAYYHYPLNKRSF